MSDRTAILLQRLEAGLRTDANRLKEMEREFLLTLEGVRRMGDLPGPAAEWKAAWNQQWQTVEQTLQDISRRLLQIHEHLEHDDKAELLKTLKLWRTLQPEETSLEQALDGLRIRAGELAGDAHHDWETQDRLIRTHLADLNNTMEAMRVKLQLLLQYPREEVDRIAAAVLARHPGEETEISEEYIQQFRQAAIDIEKEQHQVGNIVDDIKAMFLWMDTPEERMREKEEADARRNPPVVKPAVSPTIVTHAAL